jgi:putative transposase
VRQAEAGEKVSELCRKVGSAKRPTMPGRNSTPGWGGSELRELRQLRDENGRLKRMVAL